jgi:hypothetical protein
LSQSAFKINKSAFSGFCEILFKIIKPFLAMLKAQFSSPFLGKFFQNFSDFLLSKNGSTGDKIKSFSSHFSF